MTDIRYNIDLFKIGEYENGYKHYLIFLIKYFFHSKDFSGRVEKREFINKGEEYGFSRDELLKIFQRWITDNHFISRIENKETTSYIYIKWSYNKTGLGTMLVYVDKKICRDVISLQNFRYLCYIIIASRISMVNWNVKKVDYTQDLYSRSLSTIGRSFWWCSKSTMSRRISQAHKVFQHIFNKTHRYTTNNGYLEQMTNIYSLRWVRYVYRYRSKYTPKQIRQNKQEHHWIMKNGRSSGEERKKFVMPEFITKTKVNIWEYTPIKGYYIWGKYITKKDA